MNEGLSWILATALSLVLWAGALTAEEMPATCEQGCPAPFVVNQFWTTEYGPAAANVVLSTHNFLACSSDFYALCYFSGPDTSPTGPDGKPLPRLPCTVSDKDPGSADCRCYVESGESYVDIHSIRNTEAYVETVRVCGQNGAKCRNMASVAAEKAAVQLGVTPESLPTAPVCSYLQADADGFTPMEPGSQLISTYSFAESIHYGVTPTDCSGSPGPYAGCMTASCVFERDGHQAKTGFADCKCPISSGPYQVGQEGVSCDAGSGYVWSAAYTPPSTQ